MRTAARGCNKQRVWGSYKNIKHGVVNVILFADNNKPVTFVVLANGTNRFAIGTDTSVSVFEWNGKSNQKINPPDDIKLKTKPGETVVTGAVDPKGRLYVGEYHVTILIGRALDVFGRVLIFFSSDGVDILIDTDAYSNSGEYTRCLPIFSPYFPVSEKLLTISKNDSSEVISRVV